MMKLSIIIPAYNEADGVAYTAAALQNVLADLRQTYELELIFVNDGSKDDTAALLQEAFAAHKDVTVVSHEVNLGLGAAIRTGFKHAKGDIVVTTDFDGTYDFRTIPELLKYMAKPDVDIVTASPYHRDGGVRGVPKYRLLFSYSASLLYRVLVDFRILTWTALFRAYRRSVVDNVEFESNEFLAGTELLVKAIQQGYRVAEFPTILDSRAYGQSSMKIARVTWSHLQFQSRLLKDSVIHFNVHRLFRKPLPATQERPEASLPL
jgi:dolichol-phosphate mannosyltransferase